jgi:hypothetical protein
MADVIQLRRADRAEPARSLFAPTELVNDLIPGGENLRHDVRVGLDLWDLAGHRAWRDKAGKATKLDFGKLNVRWRDAAKELLLLQMNPSLAPERASGNPMAENWPHVQELIGPITAQGNLKMLWHALRVIDKHMIANFDSDDWQRLVFLLVQPFDVEDKRSGTVLSANTGRGRAQQLIALWQTTQISSREGMLGRGLPFDGQDLKALFGNKPRRNSVRPHESVGHALGYNAWIFDHIADDIVAHIEWWAANTAPEAPLSREELREAMFDLAGDIAQRTGGVLPGSRNVNGTVTLAHAPLARLLRVYDADEAYLAGRWVMSQLRGHVTLSEQCSPCPLPVTELPTRDGRDVSWAPRLLANDDELDIWQRRLVYAALYYLSATIMLRDSQLAVLPLDCLVTDQVERPDGTSYVKHTLRAFKTKNRHVPTPTTVTVNARVAHIVQLMQRLQRVLGYEPALHPLTGLPHLFDQRLATPVGKQIRTGNRDGVYLDLSFVKVMREGAKYLYERGVISRDLTDVKLNMRQVRITCAQAYAVREHGQALAAAFGQWDTAAVAAGYVGDVYKLITPLEPEDTVDVASEDTGRRLARTARMRDGLTGSGLARLDAAVATNAAPLSNPAPLTPARLVSLGKKNRYIEQGPLTLCIYQPEGALCGGKGKPDFRLCLPGQCRNSVMSPVDRARYELMRRQHLALKSEVLRRAADKMDDANPDIRKEFENLSDEDLQRIIADHVDDYVRAALEGTA